MSTEKTLPQDESAKGQDEGPVPATRDGRIKLATEKGGLKSCPSSFSNEYLDWETIKSDSSFEVLYLDYRAYDRISRAIIDSNLGIIKKFWSDTAAKAMSSPPVAKKYGGMDSIRRYPQVLQKAYAELTSDANAPKQCFEQIIQKKLESIRTSIESTLIQGEYTLEIRKDITQKGLGIGLTKEDVDSFLIGVLKEKGFKTERENSNDPLSEHWYSLEKWDQREQERQKGGRKELDSVIEGILSDGAYEPRELSVIKEKGKKLGYAEDKTYSYIEEKLREHDFSPDPESNIKPSDSLDKKLSVTWRTEEKHLEVSAHKFRAFLDGKLLNGIYDPNDYVSITEAATGFLRRDAVKLKETLLYYLKEKDFKPTRAFQIGHDLTVEWKTDWANKTPPPPPKPIFMKAILAIGIVIAVLSGIFLLKKQSVEPPANNAVQAVTPPLKTTGKVGKSKPLGTKHLPATASTGQDNMGQNDNNKSASPTMEPDVKDLEVTITDMDNRPIVNLLPGQTIKLTSEYTVLATSEVDKVDIEENNYLIMPDGTKSPDAIRTKTRDAGRVMSKQAVTLPNELPIGSYTHVATVKVGGKTNKATQTVMVTVDANKSWQDQLTKQLEIDEYLTEGKQFFEKGKYELCIEKMKEVIKRDSNNDEAKNYIKMSTDKIEKIRNNFANPTFGGSE